jgi:lysophospholipase L1-like esterase
LRHVRLLSVVDLMSRPGGGSPLRLLGPVRCALVVVGALLAGVLVDAPSAVASPQAGRPASAQLRRVDHRRVDTGPSYYLALGDSVPVWNGTNSYPYLILSRYQRKLPGLTLDDIAISGETTTSMLQDGQYQSALSFLQTHKGHIALITIDIGGNDVVGCALSIDTAAPDSPCSVQARATIKQNLTLMLAGLHAAAPGVPVIGMSYYDPLLGDWLGGGAFRALALTTLRSLVVLNRHLTSLYGGARKTANVQGIFHSTDLRTMVVSPWGEVPIAVQRACAWLDIFCQAGAPEGFGDDPNNAGAVAIAMAFERRISRLCIRRRSGVLRRC